MKYFIKIVGIGITVLIIGFFAVYLFFGFINYLISDPLDLFDDTPTQQEIEQETAYQKEKEEREKDLQICRDAGGIPKKSFWDGRIADCIKVEQHE